MSFRVDVWEGGRIALFSLRANRLRTVLTTVGIGVGVCTLLAIVGIIQGINQSFADQLAQIGANTLQVSKFPWTMRGDWWEYRNRKNLSADLVEPILQASEHVVAAAPLYFDRVEARFLERRMASVTALGTTADYAIISSFTVDRGRFLTDADVDNRAQVAVIGAELARTLFPGLDPVGHRIILGSKPYRVVGSLEAKGTILGENQDTVVVLPFRTFQADFGKRNSPNIAVSVDSPDNVLKVQDQLTVALRRERRTPPEAKDDFAINRPEQLANMYAQLTGALYGAATGVGLITLLVGGIGIMNIMLVSVRERTREIGVRRALGAKKRTIILQFLMEAASVSAVGGTLGTVVGLGLAKTVSFITPLAATVEPLTVAGGVGFAAMVGLLFGIWPAARAANLDPVEALRHD
ncbi:putative ABC transport system permease protein [Myxococcus fulvus]|uniref:ABC transport system permease protein n=2 Tax=Myxococcus TaxID=32 RepID=A0A511TGP1_MYXFU|nr:ABC transporter permease [Myxococcus fulvus]GEN13339.1 ABC transporter ATP-binding protein [Myxococcus fulvus]SEU41729.1 putative ABC transport system permease protein [Myxococcus fulvus]